MVDEGFTIPFNITGNVPEHLKRSKAAAQDMEEAFRQLKQQADNYRPQNC